MVASPGNRPDQLAVRPEGFAQRGNLALQPVFLDDPARPDPAQQLVLADHSPRRLDQRQQQVEGASAEPYRPAFGEQLAAMRQDAEVAKFDDRRRVRRASHAAIVNHVTAGNHRLSQVAGAAPPSVIGPAVGQNPETVELHHRGQGRSDELRPMIVIDIFKENHRFSN